MPIGCNKPLSLLSNLLSDALGAEGKKNTISVVAARAADGALVGKWSFANSEGRVLAGDAWKAVKQESIGLIPYFDTTVCRGDAP